jgi:hypothetical protein
MFPYKREVYNGPTTHTAPPPANADDPAEEPSSDQPPQKRLRTTQAPGPSTPTQGTIRSDPESNPQENSIDAAVL